MEAPLWRLVLQVCLNHGQAFVLLVDEVLPRKSPRRVTEFLHSICDHNKLWGSLVINLDCWHLELCPRVLEHVPPTIQLLRVIIQKRPAREFPALPISHLRGTLKQLSYMALKNCVVDWTLSTFDNLQELHLSPAFDSGHRIDPRKSSVLPWLSTMPLLKQLDLLNTDLDQSSDYNSRWHDPIPLKGDSIPALQHLRADGLDIEAATELLHKSCETLVSFVIKPDSRRDDADEMSDFLNIAGYLWPVRRWRESGEVTPLLTIQATNSTIIFSCLSTQISIADAYPPLSEEDELDIAHVTLILREFIAHIPIGDMEVEALSLSITSSQPEELLRCVCRVVDEHWPHIRELQWLPDDPWFLEIALDVRRNPPAPDMLYPFKNLEALHLPSRFMEMEVLQNVIETREMAGGLAKKIDQIWCHGNDVETIREALSEYGVMVEPV